MIQKLKYIIPCILLLLVQFFCTNSASAYEIVQSVELVNASSTPGAAYTASSSSACSRNGSAIIGQDSSTYPYCEIIDIEFPNLNWNVQRGQIIQITFALTNYGRNDSSDAHFGGAYVTINRSVNLGGQTYVAPTLSTSLEMASSSSGLARILVRVDNTTPIVSISVKRQAPNWVFNLQPNEVLKPISVELFNTASTNIPDPSGAIQETAHITHQLQDQTNAQIASLVSSQSISNDLAREHIAKTEEQTRQQKEQYEQDKQEEADRENQMQGAADDAAGLFNFSIRNPLEPIFGAFTAGNCVAIPNLARMVGSTETTYCSWFSSSTRAILTPVISIFSIIILFGFVVKWLNKDDGGGE